MPNVLWGVACVSLPGRTSAGEVIRQFREALSLGGSPGRNLVNVDLYRLVPIADSTTDLDGEELVMAHVPDSSFGTTDMEDVFRQRDEMEQRFDRVRESLVGLLEAIDWTDDGQGHNTKLRCQSRVCGLSKEIMHVMCQEIRTLREQKQSTERWMKEQMETVSSFKDLKQDMVSFTQAVRLMEEKASGSGSLRSGLDNLAATIEATADFIHQQSPSNNSAGIGRCMQAGQPVPVPARATAQFPRCTTPPLGLLRCSSEVSPVVATSSSTSFPVSLHTPKAGASQAPPPASPSPADSESTDGEAEAEALPPLGLLRARPVVPRINGLGGIAAAAAAAAAEGLPSDRSPGVTTTNSASSTSRGDGPISARSPGSSNVAFATRPLSARTPGGGASARSPASCGNLAFVGPASARTPGSSAASARSPAAAAGPASARFISGPASTQSSGGGGVAIATALASAPGSASARASFRRIAPLQLATPRRSACPNVVGAGATGGSMASLLAGTAGPLPSPRARN